MFILTDRVFHASKIPHLLMHGLELMLGVTNYLNKKEHGQSCITTQKQYNIC